MSQCSNCRSEDLYQYEDLPNVAWCSTSRLTTPCSVFDLRITGTASRAIADLTPIGVEIPLHRFSERVNKGG